MGRSVRCAALLVWLSTMHASAAETGAVRRPRIVGLSHVALFVHDVEQARAFYKGFLGFGEPYSLSDPDGALHLTWIKINDHQTIELFPEKEAGTDRLNHVAVEVDDAEAMHAYLASRGIDVPPTVMKGRIGNSNFTAKDPDGHAVEFVEYEPDGWTVREKGRHLPDTRISSRLRHAGLSIGDLEASLRFYRDVLGFKETWRGSRDGKQLSWVNLTVPDGDDYLELMLADAPPDTTRLAIQHHVCLEVDDVPQAWRTLEARPRPKSSKAPTPLRVGINGKRQINMYDPDGTRVEIMEPGTADGKPIPPSDAPPPEPSRRSQ